jgi:ferredoxin
MFVRIDPVRCTGHGRCYSVAPELFDCDDEGRGVVTRDHVTPELELLAQRAVASCPERAVSLSASRVPPAAITSTEP